MQRDALVIMGAILLLGGVFVGFILADLGQGWVLWIILGVVVWLLGALYKAVE